MNDEASVPIEAEVLPEIEPLMTAQPSTSEDAEEQIHRISRRSFLWAGVSVASGFTAWRWLIGRRTDNGVPWPFRRALEVNEQLSRDFFSPGRLAPTFPESMAAMPRSNGDVGLSEELDVSTWRLRVEGAHGADEPLELTMDDVRKLPRVEITTELKCIEGWSQVVHWTGVRLADFMVAHPPTTLSGDDPDVKDKPQDLPAYVGMATPDGAYYVGLDRESALHPQTLLCYEMNGQPLEADHGAPLRLAIPVKYGIKNIKRIGTIRYTSQRPADYWAEQGYDYYAGH
jgi:hypothetical protein